MKIGVFLPKGCPLSMQIYFTNVSKILSKNHDVEFVIFNRTQSIPKDVDLYWDPRSGGGQAPYRKLYSSKIPIVVTVHGLSLFSIPFNIQFSKKSDYLNGIARKLRYSSEWAFWKGKIQSLITVSQYAKEEIVQYLKFDDKQIAPIYHGVDKEVFYPSIENNTRKYLLHISSYQPKKNLDRIIEAYSLIPEADRIPMKIVAPGYKRKVNISHLELVTEKINHQQAAELYRNARAFVFPSLHESFGMPLAEAMSCGCPIITSNTTACPEIVGEAGILVNPEKVYEINNAMLQIINDDDLFSLLQKNAIKRTNSFGWEKSAEEHLKVFKRAIVDYK
jgi:glycosyltransferase involved in cell wall biosynthesis